MSVRPDAAGVFGRVVGELESAREPDHALQRRGLDRLRADERPVVRLGVLELVRRGEGRGVRGALELLVRGHDERRVDPIPTIMRRRRTPTATRSEIAPRRKTAGRSRAWKSSRVAGA
jgi:hypothetical protein